MENLRNTMLSLYNHKKTNCVITSSLACKNVLMPGDRFFGGEAGEDIWGVHWTNLGPDLGMDGSTPTPGREILPDITCWREVVRFPEYDKMPLEEIFGGMLADVDRERQVVSGLLLSGTFERMHALMGMENAMCSFYEEPEAVFELMNAIADSRIEAIDKMIECFDPDIIYMHDDWGMATNMLISPDLWREFFKPIEKRYTDHIHGRGKLYEHHSCGYITPIVGDLVELGVDALNPMNPCNDIEGILREFGSQILVLGGLDGQLIDRAETGESEIREHVRKTIDQYAPLGLFSPFYIPTSRQRQQIVDDETMQYGKDYYLQ